MSVVTLLLAYFCNWSEFEVLATKVWKKSIDHLIGDKDWVKKARVFPLPEEEVWKISMMEEICLAKKEHIEIEFDMDELDEILYLLPMLCWGGGRWSTL